MKRVSSRALLAAVPVKLMEIIIATAVIFIGSFVQSSLGFGLAIISAPVLFFLDPLYVPAPITVAALTLSLANAAKHSNSISFSGLKFALVGRIPGTIAGGLLLYNCLEAYAQSHVLCRIFIGLYGYKYLNWRPTNGFTSTT